jgi:hypothetical protein
LQAFGPIRRQGQVVKTAATPGSKGLDIEMRMCFNFGLDEGMKIFWSRRCKRGFTRFSGFEIFRQRLDKDKKLLHNLVSLLHADLFFKNLTADKCGRLMTGSTARRCVDSHESRIVRKCTNVIPSAHIDRNEEVRFSLTRLRLSLSIATYEPTFIG